MLNLLHSVLKGRHVDNPQRQLGEARPTERKALQGRNLDRSIVTPRWGLKLWGGRRPPGSRRPLLPYNIHITPRWG